MKKLLGILVLGLLFHINPLNTNNSNADHYKTGILFGDPFYTGCVYNAEGCIHRSPNVYFNEKKHKGSYKKAEKACYGYLKGWGYRNIIGFAHKLNSPTDDYYYLECWD